MYALGVDIGGTKIAAGVVDEDGNLLAQVRKPTDPSDAANIDRSIAEAYQELSSSYEISAIGLAAAIPGTQRLVSVEEVFELKTSHPDWVAMQTRQAGLEGTGEITLRMLVKEALRMRPNRIIVGEVRAEEALDLLLALNSGLPGMASIHANSAIVSTLSLTILMSAPCWIATAMAPGLASP